MKTRTAEMDQWLRDTFGLDVAQYEPSPEEAAPGALKVVGTPPPPDAPPELVPPPGSTPEAPAPPPVLGTMQQARAAALAAKLTPDDQAKYQALLTGAKSDVEREYVTKGLAAGHSVAELDKFAERIAGKDAAWLRDHLSLTDDSHGKGVQQQWSMSCNATAVEAVRGQLDPLYALQVHDENPDVTQADRNDPTKKNTALAADQKQMLESKGPDGHAGVAAPLNDQTGTGAGRFNTDLLNSTPNQTGAVFKQELVGAGLTIDDGVAAMDKSLATGTPVPVIIGDGGPNKTAHYVVVTSINPGPSPTYNIHDPASGTTYVRTADQLRKGRLNVAGWNTVAGFEMPTPAP